MSKTKQQKFTDSLRQTQTNTFSDGLNMDLHPLSTPNTVLTDCINGTMITYNDNEFVLQNERGNTKIVKAQLKDGFIPVAMKECNGILYIVSYNPQTKENEIGSFPSPKINDTQANSEFNSDDIVTTSALNYSDFISKFSIYDTNVKISNYDKYKLDITSDNPMLALEHFILDDNGVSTKISLTNTSTELQRFQYSGEGVLGYQYRPYYLSNMVINVNKSKARNYSTINISVDSYDDELYNSDIKCKCKLQFFLIDDEGNKIEYHTTEESSIFSGMEVDIDLIKSHYLQGSKSLTLNFPDQFRIGDDVYTVFDGMIRKNDTAEISNIEIMVTPILYKGDFSIIMDTLIYSEVFSAGSIFVKPSWFSKFQYNQVGQSDKWTIHATLDFSKFDPNYEQGKTYKVDLNSYYKLYEIQSNGNIVGVENLNATTLGFPILPDNDANTPRLSWIIKDNAYNIKTLNGEITPISISDPNKQHCVPVQVNTSKYVTYTKTGDSYNANLYNQNNIKIQTLSLAGCSEEDIKELIDEKVDFSTGVVDFIINDVSLEMYKFYVLEMYITIDEQTYNPSFIVITDPRILNYKVQGVTPDRMDQINFSDWHEVIINATNKTSNITYESNNTEYEQNLIPLKEIRDIIENNSADETKENAIHALVAKKFLKFNQCYTSDSANEIPTIYQSLTVTTNITIADSKYDYVIQNNDQVISNKIVNKIYKSLALDKEIAESSIQNTRRKYLSTIYDSPESLELRIGACYGANLKKAAKTPGRIISYEIDDEKYAFILACEIEGNKTYLQNNYLDHNFPLCRIGHLMSKVRANKCEVNINTWNDVNQVWIPYVNFNYNNKTYTPNKIYIDGYLSYTNTIEYASDGTVSPQNEYCNDFCVSAGHMYAKGLRGWSYTNIPESHPDVVFGYDNKKIWMFGKDAVTGLYKLLAVSLHTDLTTTLNIRNFLIKHAYIVETIDPTLVYQFKYLTDRGEPVLIQKEDTTITGVDVKVYPKQCLADLSRFDIQGLNNLDIHNIASNHINITFDNKFVNWDSAYSIYLSYLGKLINSNMLTENYLSQNVYEPDRVQFDFTDKLYNKELESKQIKSGEMPNTLPIYIDKKYKMAYVVHYPTDEVNHIYHNDGCDWDDNSQLPWSYNLDFADFWDISKETVQDLKDYYSLAFYKTTDYVIK